MYSDLNDVNTSKNNISNTMKHRSKYKMNNHLISCNSSNNDINSSQLSLFAKRDLIFEESGNDDSNGNGNSNSNRNSNGNKQNVSNNTHGCGHSTNIENNSICNKHLCNDSSAVGFDVYLTATISLTIEKIKLFGRKIFKGYEWTSDTELSKFKVWSMNAIKFELCYDTNKISY